MLSLNEKRKIFKDYALSKGFWINDGIKYGLDFLVYTDNPTKQHSKYGAVIYKKMSYQDLILYQRVCNTNNKEFIIVDVLEDEQIELYTCARFIL